MDKELIINFVISQIGEEKAKEVIEMLLGLADKMTNDKIYILKKLGDKGVCLISTDMNKCKIDFSGESHPSITELENELKKIEI